MFRSTGIYSVLVITVACVLCGCAQRRFGPGGSSAQEPMQHGSAEAEQQQTFVETQSAPADSAISADVEPIADNAGLPRELPPPEGAIAATTHSALPAPAPDAEPLAAAAPTIAADENTLAAPSDVAVDQAVSPVETTGANMVEAVVEETIDAEPPSPPVRSVEAAELDREFAELRALRDSLQESFQQSSKATKLTTQTAMSGNIDEMLKELTAQVGLLTRQPVPVQSGIGPVRSMAADSRRDTVSVSDARTVASRGSSRVRQIGHETAASIPAPDDLLGVGQYLLEQGRHRDAEAALRGAVRLAASDADRTLATYLLGISQIRQRRRSSAEISFRAVTRSSDAALAALARWQLKQMELPLRRAGASGSGQ